MSFDGKVYLITGASAGIGAELAVHLAKEGASLALVGRSTEKFEKLVNRIKDEGVEVEPLIILADVSTDGECIVAETIEKYGKIDVLVNNAGFAIMDSIETFSLDTFDKVMGTNIRGLLFLTHAAVPHLIESKGNIVNVTSCAGNRAFANFLTYSVSKAALEHITKCIALELAPKGVRVNSVAPGVIDTDFHETAGYAGGNNEALLENFARVHPLGRCGRSDEVVKAIVFISDDRNASFIAGATLPVDGGRIINNE